MKKLWQRFSLILPVLGLGLLAACSSLKEGECRRDINCKGKVEGLAACYKEPLDAEIGKCMTVKEARAALAAYKKRSSGKCVDKDGDGVRGGTACTGIVDCNDDDPAIKPGATEVCDGKDNNCDGNINEGIKGCTGTMLGGKQEPVVKFMVTLPSGVEVAPNGDVWISDEHRIYRMDAKTKVERIAGSNKPGNDDKKGTLARLDRPRGMAVDGAGNVFIAECRNNCIRKLAPDGRLTRYAGFCRGEPDDNGLDLEGNWDTARFWCPIDLSFDKDGSLVVVDMLNSKIKRIGKDRKVSTIAGKGGHEDDDGYTVFGYSNGPAMKAEFNEPAGIAVGKGGEIYIADSKNHCIRMLKDGKVSTFAGACENGSDKGGHKDGPAAKAKFKLPNSVDVGPDGAVWVADTGNHCIRKIQGGEVSTVSGTPNQQGYYDGKMASALFNGPQAVAVGANGYVYVIDTGNYRLRVLVP